MLYMRFMRCAMYYGGVMCGGYLLGIIYHNGPAADIRM